MNQPTATSHFHFSPRPNRAAEISWQPWSETAFTAAQAADRPILLAISAVWCHWCHVMDETTYSDPAVIELINRQLVAIRVDNDLRPDINQRYNLGGWPTTALLTPEGDILAGGTYLPAAELLNLINRVLEAWSDQRQLIVERAAANRQHAQKLILKSVGEIDSSIIDQTLDTTVRAYDPINGGFGDAPKFPHPDALLFLAEQSIVRKQPELMEMARHSLRQMAGGGMYDHVEGGFFRYSTAADWSVPHFEKMLEDHAGLISILALTGEVAILDDTVRYLGGTLLDPATGLYGGSQDADEEYYSLGREERQSLALPPVDRRIYASWNCQLATAYLEASLLCDRPRLKERAEALLDHLFVDFFSSTEGMQHTNQVDGQLADQLWALRAATAAFSHGLGEHWRGQALQLAELLERQYADPELGGYFDHAGRDRLGRLADPVKPLAENANVAIALWQLDVLSANPAAPLIDRARRALAAVVGQSHHSSLAAATLARAADRLLRPPVKVTTGSPTLARAALRANPYTIIEHSTSSEAVVCIGTTCLQPTADSEQLREQITKI